MGQKRKRPSKRRPESGNREQLHKANAILPPRVRRRASRTIHHLPTHAEPLKASLPIATMRQRKPTRCTRVSTILNRRTLPSYISVRANCFGITSVDQERG